MKDGTRSDRARGDRDAVKCDVVEVEASEYIGYANMAKEAERWRKRAVEAVAEAGRMRRVVLAAIEYQRAVREEIERGHDDGYCYRMGTALFAAVAVYLARAAREAEGGSR